MMSAQRFLLQHLQNQWSIVTLIGEYKAACQYWFIGDWRLIQAESPAEAVQIFLYHPAIHRNEILRHMMHWLTGDPHHGHFDGINQDLLLNALINNSCRPQAFGQHTWYRLWIHKVFHPLENKSRFFKFDSENEMFAFHDDLPRTHFIRTRQFLGQYIPLKDLVTWLLAYGHLKRVYYTWPPRNFSVYTTPFPKSVPEEEENHGYTELTADLLANRRCPGGASPYTLTH